MSSHHFVKEGQEPALLILEATSYSDAEGMLEWAPMVIVVESVLEHVLLWGIKIDVVIALPENQSSLTSTLADQAPIRIFSAGQDLVESALQFVKGTGQGAVSIMAGDFNETLRARIEAMMAKTQVTVRTPRKKWSFIEAGHFKKWFQAGAIVDFLNVQFNPGLKAARLRQAGFELTEDQWITIENSTPFWVSEDL